MMADYQNQDAAAKTIARRKSASQVAAAQRKKTSTRNAAPTPTVNDWGDGKQHSISLKTHNANVKAKALAPYSLGDNSIYGDPSQVKTAVNSAADLKYGQPIQTQNQQIAASQQRQNVDLPGWFQQYRDAVANARAASSQEYTNAAAASSTAAPAATGDPLADQAAANRAAMQNVFADMLRTQGANTTTNYDQAGANSNLYQLGMQNSESLNRQNLTAQLGQLQQEKGEYANTTLAGYKSDQAKYNSDLAAADAATAAATGKLTEQHNEFATSQTNAQTKADNTVTKWGYTNAEWRALSASDRQSVIDAQKPPKAGAKPNTKDYYGHTWAEWSKMGPSQRRSAVKLFQKAKSTGKTDTTSNRTPVNQWNGALQYVRDLPKGSNPTVSEISKNAAVPNDVANAVYEWYRHGGTVTQATADKLRSIGVNVTTTHIKG